MQQTDKNNSNVSVPPTPVTGDAPGTIDVAIDSNRTPRKVYVVVGRVMEFETASAAAKFLNSEAAPAAYQVLRGTPITVGSKVVLR